MLEASLLPLVTKATTLFLPLQSGTIQPHLATLAAQTRYFLSGQLIGDFERQLGEDSNRRQLPYHPAMDAYDYYWRIDSDAFLLAQVMSLRKRRH